MRSKNSQRIPSYRLHKPSGLAVVTLAGRDHYLGRHGSLESRAEYDRLVAEWLATGRRGTTPRLSTALPSLVVADLILAYLKHCDSYYVKNGKPTSEVRDIELAMRPLRKLYGHTLVLDFGPLSLKAVRQELITARLSRGEVNKRIARIVRAFKWAVGEELIPSTVHQALKAVEGLKRGRCECREPAPVRPVPDSHVDAIRPFVSRQVWAMIELQRLTGMRPGEVVIMRTGDLDMSETAWTYTPSSHKTEHHARIRRIPLGPRAQEILRPWLRTEPEAFLFSPAEAMADRNTARRAARKSPVQPSQRDRSSPRARRKPAAHYTVPSYNRAIDRACDKAYVPRWHPHQLRHSAATLLRKKFGIDVAKAVLGHSSLATTEIYAEFDAEKATQAMLKIG